MREIKFRVWNTKSKKMWSHKTIERNKIFALTSELPIGDFLVIPKGENHILMQYTGLCDSKGVEIYEGDILERTMLPTKPLKFKFKIVFEEERATFTAVDIEGYSKTWIGDYLFLPYESEVIGNIYENEDLLT